MSWVFAYGSLVLTESIAETIGPAPDRRVVPATLDGWRRGFTQCRDNRACEKTFALGDGTVPPFILGLNVHPAPGEEVSGVAIEVTSAELARLDGRELRYDRTDVTGSMRAEEKLAGSVFTYVAKPEHLALKAPPGAVILRSYLEAVETAFASLGGPERLALRRSVLPLPAPVVDARLVADLIPPGNPRGW